MRSLLGAMVPPLCAACGRDGARDGALLCPGCLRRLADAEPLTGRGPAGIDRAWSSAPHQGVARDLVASLKYRRLLPLAGLMADRIQALAPGWLLGGEVVPVPGAPLRFLARGFDPAGELAAELAERCDRPLRGCLARRGVGRQVGRRRGLRLGDPPRVSAVGEVPASVVLVDDVMTTGATLSACAQALRGAGARRVVAVTFSRRP